MAAAEQAQGVFGPGGGWYGLGALHLLQRPLAGGTLGQMLLHQRLAGGAADAVGIGRQKIANHITVHRQTSFH